MRMRWLLVAPLVLGLPLSSPASVQAGPNEDRVVTDSGGREVRRIRILADGRTETSQVTWTGARMKAVSSETKEAGGRVVRRSWKRFDERGRVSEVGAVEVDEHGHERGSRKIYTYSARGSRREQTLAIE